MPGRPLRAESLSEPAIIKAALRLARDSGLEAVRMRDVATELAAALGALYHHVPNQSAMQAVVVQHVLGDLPTARQSAGTPRQRIVATMRGIQRALEDNPGVTATVIAAAPYSTIGRTMRRELLATLRETGLTQVEAE